MIKKINLLIFFILTLNFCTYATDNLDNISNIKKPVKKTFTIKSFFKDSDFELIVHEIIDSVYVIQDNTFFVAPNNSLVLKISEKDLLIIDTPYTPEGTEVLFEWIDKNFPNYDIVAINTHAHVDRTGGNEILLKRHIPIWGSDKTVIAGCTHCEEEKQNLVNLTISKPKISNLFKKRKFYPPNNLFSLKEGKNLKIADKEIQIIYPGPGHTEDNVVVYIPHIKLLFGGCFISARPSIFISHETYIQQWDDSLKNIQDIVVDWVIPGHPSNQGSTDFSPNLILYTRECIKNAMVKLNDKSNN